MKNIQNNNTIIKNKNKNKNYHAQRADPRLFKPNYQVKFVIKFFFFFLFEKKFVIKLETNQIKHTFISENPILDIFKSSYYGKARTKSCEIIYHL